MLKSVMHVESYVESMLKISALILSGRFQGMLKTVICVENYVGTGC